MIVMNGSVRSNLWFSGFLFVGGVFVSIFGYAMTVIQADSVAESLAQRIDVPVKVLLGHLVELSGRSGTVQSVVMSGPWFVLSVVFAVRGVMEYLESDDEGEVVDVIE